MKPKKQKKKSAKPAKTTTQAKGSKVKALNEIDYVHQEGEFGKFEVRKTANAWWGSQSGGQAKLIAFLQGVKMAMSIRQSCSFAGLTEKQVDYFLEIHPEFCDILPVLSEEVNVAAVVNVANAVKGDKEKQIPGDLETSKWLLPRTMKEAYSTRKELTGADGRPLNPLEGMTDEELDAEEAALDKQLGK